MTDRPEPLSPAECDLNGYEWMPFLGSKLFQSRFYAHASDAEFRAAIHLWWSSWQECPAGSLPNDDRQLAVMAGFGRDVKGWGKVKKMAMHGFVECSDGRFYHPLIAEEAVKSYETKLKNDKKRAADKERLQKWRDAQAAKRASKRQTPSSGGASETADETLPETADETRFTTHYETPGETQNVASGNDVIHRQIQSSLRSDTPHGNPPRSKRRSECGTLLDPGWQPDAEERDYAQQRGLDPDRTAENFRDYWLGKPAKSAKMSDWRRTWQRWCRTDATWKSERRKSGKLDWLAVPGADDFAGKTIEHGSFH